MQCLPEFVRCVKLLCDGESVSCCCVCGCQIHTHALSSVWADVFSGYQTYNCPTIIDSKCDKSATLNVPHKLISPWHTE